MNDFKEKKIEEFNKLVAGDDTSFQDLESFISQTIGETRKETIESLKRWKQDEFEPLYYEITLGGHPQQELDSKGDRWMHYQDIVVDHAEDANKTLLELLDKLKNQEDFTTDERGKK